MRLSETSLLCVEFPDLCYSVLLHCVVEDDGEGTRWPKFPLKEGNRLPTPLTTDDTVCPREGTWKDDSWILLKETNKEN